jgi:di/tricarboxylate transporter
MTSIITIVIIVIAIILLVGSRLRPDLIALMVMLALGLTQVVSSSEVFSGFSSSAVMTILGISMISVSLQQTGAANALGKLIYKIGGKNETLSVLFVTLSSAVLSLFMNNIAAVGVLLPAVMSLSRRSRISPSRLLIPLAFGTILGGMATLLTTANIIVSGALKQANLESFGLLDYFPVGGPVALVGIIYLVTLGRKLLPAKISKDSEGITRLSERLQKQYFPDQRFRRVRILPESPMAGLSIQKGGWESEVGIQIVAVHRGKKIFNTTPPRMKIEANDILLITGSVSDSVITPLGLVDDSSNTVTTTLINDEEPLAEVMITPHSRMIGKNICEIDIRNRLGLNVLGIWRHSKPITVNFNRLTLQFGDALLVQGAADQIHSLHHDHDLMLLEEDPDTVFRPKKIGLALAITLVTLTFASMDIYPVALVIISGAVVLMLTGCMSITDAFQRIEWKPIFLIAGMWPLTIAIQKTGLAENAIQAVIPLLESISPVWIVAAFLFFSMLLALFISGPVAPIVIIPVALQAAQSLGIDPHPIAMAVALGCSLAFIFPVSHPVNVMVMNPGGYKLKDFARVGIPLTVIAYLTILLMITWIWAL